MPDLTSVPAVSTRPNRAKVTLDKTGTRDEILRAIQGLESIDRSSGLLRVLSVVVGIAAAFVFANAVDILPFAMRLNLDEDDKVFGGFGITAALVIVAGMLFFRARGRDVEDRKVDAIARPLQILRDELKANGRFHLQMDFKRPGNGAPGAFEVTWLDCTFVLLDGVRGRLRATTKLKRKTRAKRKYTKVKEALTETVHLELKAPGLTLDPARQGEAKRALAGRASLTVKPNGVAIRATTRKAFRTYDRAGWRVHHFDGLVDGRMSTDLIVRAYRALALAKA